MEYILLLAVAMSLVITFYRSATFQKFFGEQGELGKAYKSQAEWGYRHGLPKRDKADEGNAPIDSAENHSSYYNQAASETRFFGPKDSYP